MLVKQRVTNDHTNPFRSLFKNSTEIFCFRAFSVMALLSTLCAMTGCNQASPATNAEKAPASNTNRFDTPRALLESMRQSLVNADENLFVRCFKVDGAFNDSVHGVCKKLRATYDLQQAIEKNYGQGGWDEFQKAGEKMGPQPRITPYAAPLAEEWWAKLEIQQNGETAAFVNPVTQLTNVMLKTDGEWKIDATSVFGPGADPVKLAKFLKMAAEAEEDEAKQLRTEKPSIDDIGVRLFQKMSAKQTGQ